MGILYVQNRGMTVSTTRMFLSRTKYIKYSMNLNKNNPVYYLESLNKWLLIAIVPIHLLKSSAYKTYCEKISGKN